MSDSTTQAALGQQLMARLDYAAHHSQPGPGVTRLFCSDEHRAVLELIADWMHQAGLTPELDASGNLVGRNERARQGERTLIMGSHQDTVAEGGKYDGMLGVALPLQALQALEEAGTELPYGVEVVAFGDEEGTRFQSTLIGSRALAGTLDPESLKARDADGVTLGEALKAFGGNPQEIPHLARRPEAVIGFVEVHIEQGPVLESEDLPVGVVTAINGASRYAVTLEGMAGHAGTVPMNLRRDALAGAAEMIAAIEERAGAEEGLVATVGRIDAAPGAINVIPGKVTFTIDLRAPDDGQRAAAVASVKEKLQAIAQRRNLELAMELLYEEGAAACDPGLMDQLDKAVERQGIRPLRLPSGAGHDAMALSALCPIAMLFVRCGGGISHNPLESITGEDAEAAAQVFLDFLENFDPNLGK